MNFATSYSPQEKELRTALFSSDYKIRLSQLATLEITAGPQSFYPGLVKESLIFEHRMYQNSPANYENKKSTFGMAMKNFARCEAILSQVRVETLLKFQTITSLQRQLVVAMGEVKNFNDSNNKARVAYLKRISKSSNAKLRGLSIAALKECAISTELLIETVKFNIDKPIGKDEIRAVGMLLLERNVDPLRILHLMIPLAGSTYGHWEWRDEFTEIATKIADKIVLRS